MSARSGSVVGLGKTRVEALTDGIFGAGMTVLGLSLTALQVFMFLTPWYATLHHHLVEAGLNDRFIWLGRRRMLLGPGFSAAGILVSFLNPVLSLGAYVLYPVFFITPGQIDRIWRRQEVK